MKCLDKLNILIVTGIFPPDFGGPASYVPIIASDLAKRHRIIRVITLSDSQKHDDSVYPFPVVRILRGQNKVLRQIKTILSIYWLSREADIVYLNGLVLEGIITCKIARRKKVAIKVVGDLIWEKARNAGIFQDTIDVFQINDSYGLRWRLLKKLQGWYTNLADIVITPSHYLSSIVKGWGVHPDKVKVVYNSLYQLPFSNEENVKKMVDCVTVARLVPWKGISELISIAIKNNWSLNIVGDGPLRQELEKQVSNAKAGGLVKFVGQVPKEQVYREIARARVFILNSTYEGLPHIVLEAKGVGVPVIATAVGGTSEVINNGVDGFLVPHGDVETLTHKIKFLLDNPEEQRRIGLTGQKQALERFSFETMASETERVLIAACK